MTKTNKTPAIRTKSELTADEFVSELFTSYDAVEATARDGVAEADEEAVEAAGFTCAEIEAACKARVAEAAKTTTYSVRRPGSTAWVEGLPTLEDAVRALSEANDVAPGHEVYRVTSAGPWVSDASAESVEEVDCDAE